MTKERKQVDGRGAARSITVEKELGGPLGPEQFTKPKFSSRIEIDSKSGARLLVFHKRA